MKHLKYYNVHSKYFMNIIEFKCSEEIIAYCDFKEYMIRVIIALMDKILTIDVIGCLVRSLH